MFYRTTVRKLLDAIEGAERELGGRENAYITIHCTDNMVKHIFSTWAGICVPFKVDEAIKKTKEPVGTILGNFIYADIKDKVFGEVTVVSELLGTVKHRTALAPEAYTVTPAHHASSFECIGTRTGRFRCDKPNISNPPKSDVQNLKSLFVEREGSDIVQGSFKGGFTDEF